MWPKILDMSSRINDMSKLFSDMHIIKNYGIRDTAYVMTAMQY